MGLNVFTLFVGSGLGSLVFQAALNAGFPAALTGFALAALIAAVAAVPAFATETAAPRSPTSGRSASRSTAVPPAASGAAEGHQARPVGNSTLGSRSSRVAGAP